MQPDPQSGLAPGGSTITGNSGAFRRQRGSRSFRICALGRGATQRRGRRPGVPKSGGGFTTITGGAIGRSTRAAVGHEPSAAGSRCRPYRGRCDRPDHSNDLKSRRLTSNAAPAPASASGSVEYAGSTLGCFGAGCTPAASSSIGGLTFTGGSSIKSPTPVQHPLEDRVVLVHSPLMAARSATRARPSRWWSASPLRAPQPATSQFSWSAASSVQIRVGLSSISPSRPRPSHILAARLI